MSTTIRDILNVKGSDVLTIDGSETVYTAVKKMVDHKVGAIIIMDEGAVCGIYTERDFLRSVVVDPRDAKTTQVKATSSCNVVAVDPSTTVEEAMAVMTEARIRHLPVMEKGNLVGLVSIGDLVKQASKDQQAHIHYLTEYLTGKYPA